MRTPFSDPLPKVFCAWIPILLFGAMLPICIAQEEGKVAVRFVSFPKIADPQKIELVTGKGETLLVELPTTSVSSPYMVARPDHWTLGKTVTGADDKPSFQAYGTAPALAHQEQLVLVIRKGKSNSDGLTLIPMDGRTENFGGGKYLFFNASKTDIACVLGDEKFSVKPSQHKIVAPKPSETREDRDYLHAYVYFRKGEEAQPFYTSTWRFNEKARSMVFLYHDPLNQRLRLHIIRDYVP